MAQAILPVKSRAMVGTRHVPVHNFPFWTGPDYGFCQPFCLQKNDEGKLLEAEN